MINTFVAVNFKLANYDYSSMVELEIIKYVNGECADSYQTIINPNEDYIDPFWADRLEIDVPNIDKYPQFIDIYDDLKAYLANNIVVYHMPYNLFVLESTCERYDLPMPVAHYVNSEKIVRRTWKELTPRGYGLTDAAIALEVPSGLNEAEITALFVTMAMSEKGMSLAELVDSVDKPRVRDRSNDKVVILVEDGDPDGFLFGETVVCTGELSVVRYEFMKIVTAAGCNFRNSITMDTTILIVGVQHQEKVHETGSKKYLTALRYNEKNGLNIRIMSEDDFMSLVKMGSKYNS